MSTNTLEGIIHDALPRGLFMVHLDDGRRVRATLGTAARRITVRVIPGDRVLVELSDVDPSRGRITAKID